MHPCHFAAAARRSTSTRRAAHLTAVMIVISLLAAGCQRRPARDVVVGGGRHVEVVTLAASAGGLGVFDPALRADTALVVQYYRGQARDDSAAAERADVLTWATPQAERLGVRYVVLQRTEHTAGRWLPFVRHGMSLYHRQPDGAWVRYKRGTAQAAP